MTYEHKSTVQQGWLHKSYTQHSKDDFEETASSTPRMVTLDMHPTQLTIVTPKLNPSSSQQGLLHYSCNASNKDRYSNTTSGTTIMMTMKKCHSDHIVQQGTSLQIGYT